ncbi:MAG TPA: hypothetical protein VGH51_16175 [Candidatus Angelobacter sp.]
MEEQFPCGEIVSGTTPILPVEVIVEGCDNPHPATPPKDAHQPHVLCKGEALRGAIALPQTAKRQSDPESTPDECNHGKPEQEHWQDNRHLDEKFSHDGSMIAHK